MDEKVFGGAYRVEREMGVETVGRTYLATGPDGRKVVVKVVRPADAMTADIVESDIAALSGIRHPALPHVYKWGHDGDDFYVVREYVGGVDMKRVLGEQERLAGVVAARYGAEAADALDLIHKRGLVHGNIKTANLIRLPEDPSAPSAIKLVGYGLGLRGDAAAITSTAPASLAYYLAPEQVAGEPVSPATDVYSLGAVLYEMVTGRVPFDGDNAAAVADRIVHDVPTPVRELDPDVPVALEAAIMKALEKSPHERFATAADFKNALEQAVRPAAPPVTVAAAAPRKTSPWLWVALIALLLLLAAGVAWALGAFRGPAQIAVPTLVGKSLTDATATITSAGLAVGNVTYTGATVAGVIDGTVTSQSPIAGTKVGAGSAIDLVLAGAQSVVVPTVTGLPQPDAVTAIQGAGLVVGAINQVTTNTVAVGAVVAQSPDAGTKVAKGGVVSITIAVAPPIAGTVPDLSNLSGDQASDALVAAGFKPKVVNQTNATVPTGEVIDQNPAAGVQAAPGSIVTIFISTGPAPIEVPAVTTRTQTDATNILTAAGFKVKVTETTGGGPVGTVIDQSPTGGTLAAPGTTVVITVAK